jgi:hypothetical protein
MATERQRLSANEPNGVKFAAIGESDNLLRQWYGLLSQWAKKIRGLEAKCSRI